MRHYVLGGFVPVFNYKENPEWDGSTIYLDSIFETEKGELKLPPANEYELIFDDEGLTVRIPGGGTFSRKIKGTVISGEPIKMKLDASYFSTIVENLSGTIKIALSSEMIIFIEKTKEHQDSMYFLGTLLE